MENQTSKQFVIAPKWVDLSKNPKANCSICKQPVYDSVNPEKIITCARCVQILLSATQENKISYRNHLLEIGDIEGTRSIESFIVPEEGTDIATFETSCLKRGSNRLVHRFKQGLKGSSYPNRKR